MATQQLEPRDVTVSRTNGHGFQIVDGSWLNFSKFAKPEDVTMPDVGHVVTVHLDKAGFVRRIDPAKLPPADNNAVNLANQTVQTPDSTPKPPTCRDTVVTRLAVLNTATSILASAGRAVDPADVVTLAAKLEAWATR